MKYLKLVNTHINSSYTVPSSGNIPLPDGPDLRNSGSGQNNNSVPTDDPDTSGHCPDTQSGFMQEKYTVRSRSMVFE